MDDSRVVAGAIVGSLAQGGGDPFSDLDLTFAVRDDATVADVLADWTTAIIGELDAIRLVDLERTATIYRVFLLRGALQFDLSMTSAALFRVGGPRFQLLFGDTGRLGRGRDSTVAPPAMMFIPTPVVAEDLFGWGVVYALHARACVERGRFWQAEPYVAATRDHALTLACLNRGLPAVEARGYEDLPAETLAALEESHVGALDARALHGALAASVRALMREGAYASIPYADEVTDDYASWPLGHAWPADVRRFHGAGDSRHSSRPLLRFHVAHECHRFFHGWSTDHVVFRKIGRLRPIFGFDTPRCRGQVVFGSPQGNSGT